MMDIEIIKDKIRHALKALYKEDKYLFDKGLCERCILHRFAVNLERQNFKDYHVDCEYNKSHLGEITTNKMVSNINGNYIDIIITKRNDNPQDDLICFEVKKWNNYDKRAKDRENLIILTGGIKFDYDYGLYIIFGKTIDKTKIEIYKSGKLSESLGNVDL